MKNNTDELKLEILKGNHLEHFNIAKTMAQIMPLDNPRRRAVEKSMNDITDEIQKIIK